MLTVCAKSNSARARVELLEDDLEDVEKETQELVRNIGLAVSCTRTGARATAFTTSRYNPKYPKWFFDGDCK